MTANLIIIAVALALALLSAYLVVLARETAAAWRRRIIIAACLLPVALAVLASTFQVDLPWGIMLGAGVVALLVVRRSGRSSALIARWARQQIRKKGVASPLDIIRFASAAAMRRTTTVIRPSMARLTRWQRARVKTTEVAVPLARSGGLNVYVSLRDVVAVFGTTGVGKTGWLAGRVIDHPGAVVTTSTRTDLMDLTRTLREKRGPVYVFNPGGLGGLASTIMFDPLTGCSDPVTATERAADMVPESQDEGNRSSYWEGQARRVLAALMHAAALGGQDMHDVQTWVANPEKNSPDVSRFLRKSTEPAFEVDFEQFYGTNKDTLTSITSSITPALKWLTTPSAVAATRSGRPFDVSSLLHEQGTVYMLGRHEAHTAPLLSALTGHIAREARRIAAHQPRGRLDPPLGLYLDEASRAVHVPLPDWTGDFGGTGIFICAAFQSRADLLGPWGKSGAAQIINNSAVVLFGGTKDADDLGQWSKLADDRDETVITYGKHGRPVSRTVRPKAVLSPGQLFALPKYRVVVFRRDLRPVIGKVSMAWRRRDVRAAARVTRRATSPALSPARAQPVARPVGVTHSPAASPAREVTRAG